MYWMRYVIPFLIYHTVEVTGFASSLVTPCPGAFVYRYHDYNKRTWYGTMVITTDMDILIVDSIRILLDTEAEDLKLYDNWPGVTVDTIDNTEYLIEGFNKKIKKNAKFSVTIALTYKEGSIPKLTAFRVNEVTFCSATNYVGSDGHFVYSEPTTLKPSTILTPKPGSSFTYAPPVINVRPSIPTEECGTRVPDVTPLIINGEPSRRGEWPWHGALYAADSRGEGLKYQCGSTLIARRYAITAAHCVTKSLRSEEPIDAGRLLFIFGKTKLTQWNEPGSQDAKVDKIIVHPAYNSSNLHNDLAIIRLHRQLDITLWVRPVCLWPKHEDPNIQLLTKRTGTVVGWGFNSKGVMSDILQHAKIPVVDSLECLYSNPTFYAQYKSQKSYCAGIPNFTSACNGDSGGGMSFQRRDGVDVWQLRGVVSLAVLNRETNICDISHYVVFTDIALYLEWIHHHVRDFS